MLGKISTEHKSVIGRVATRGGGEAEVRMAYLQAGSGRPLILIHGVVGSAENWFRNMEALGQEATVYAIDLVNMGRSGRLADVDAGLAATADRVAAFMDAAGIAEGDVAGHSHGGAVAMMLALRHPERVRSLMLFGPANGFCSLGDYLVRFYRTAVGRAFAHAVPHLPRAVHAFALRRMYGDPSKVTPRAVAGYSDGLSVPGTIAHILRILQAWFGDMARLNELVPGLAGIPTLLIWGDKDLAVGLESGEKLQRAIPGAELRVVRGAGHVVFDERPEEANRLMREWLVRGSAGEMRVGQRAERGAVRGWGGREADSSLRSG